LGIRSDRLAIKAGGLIISAGIEGHIAQLERGRGKGSIQRQSRLKIGSGRRRIAHIVAVDEASVEQDVGIIGIDLKSPPQLSQRGLGSRASLIQRPVVPMPGQELSQAQASELAMGLIETAEDRIEQIGLAADIQAGDDVPSLMAIAIDVDPNRVRIKTGPAQQI
jgi:hypothetical protein